MSGFFGSSRSARKGSFWDFGQRRQRTLRNGMSGEDVSRVQNQLNAKLSHSPPPLWVDGSFGMKTGQRVREFQQPPTGGAGCAF